MNKPLPIKEFLHLSEQFPVIDVRSPAEFQHGHIPAAYNLPLFDNEERARVGTAYKQISRQKAIEIGYEIANPKISSFITQVKNIINKQGSRNHSVRIPSEKPETVLIHCWRGGMRSAKFAELLNEHGYKTHTLIKGYKAYRNFILDSFGNNVNVVIIGGETGSGKTEILKKMVELGEQVIDLEAIAHHKGSAFGALGEKLQPTYEQFENELSSAFRKLTLSKRIWLEDESRNIGRTQIPAPLWEKMKQAPILRVNIPKKIRIERLMQDYGKFSKAELKSCILKIQHRLGGQHVKRALEELERDNLQEVAAIALTYYDKAYNYNHEKRNMKDIFILNCETDDTKVNAKNLIEFANQKIKKQYA